MAGSPDLREVLSGPVEEVAPRLLGAVLRHGPVALRLTEVEAYGGTSDPGSHAYRGPTPRTRVMFGPPGHLYCYLSHGIHTCANVSAGPDGHASAVLLRAGEVVDGVEAARARRGAVRDHLLARGPGNLCRALGIRLDHDGVDLVDGEVTLCLGDPVPAFDRGPRTGLRQAADHPWRFWLPGDPTVSPYRRHKSAAP
ncbi:MAG TPA: DNA-3-methyladenine glycosylase [Nocardioides sp.]|nr:DNA-3-methyladenine glycosylase [Nocardioides sp.]